MRWLQKIIDIILPPRCIKCGTILTQNNGLCPKCFNEITFISEPYCHKCGHPFSEIKKGQKLLCAPCAKNKNREYFRYNRSAIIYNEESKNMILGLKFMDKTENAQIMASWMFIAGKDIWESGAEIIIPVPLHYSRLLKRRYNQSALLAKELNKLCKLPVDYDSLVRHKKTRPQVEFSGHERIKNVKGAFSVKTPEKIKNKRIILIDDVLTTGSTLKECAIALKKAGAKSVDTLTIAKVI